MTVSCARYDVGTRVRPWEHVDVRVAAGGTLPASLADTVEARLQDMAIERISAGTAVAPAVGIKDGCFRIMETLGACGEQIERAFIVDTGTGLSTRLYLTTYLRHTVSASWLITFDIPAVPTVPPSVMARIRQLAPVSIREWARVFNVSHTSVVKWTDSDPTSRERLTDVLACLEEAKRYHGDLNEWLQRPVPGTSTTPLNLLAASNWRAFRGAVRSGASTPVTLDPDELLARRKADESWAVAEVTPQAAE